MGKQPRTFWRISTDAYNATSYRYELGQRKKIQTTPTTKTTDDYESLYDHYESLDDYYESLNLEPKPVRETHYDSTLPIDTQNKTNNLNINIKVIKGDSNGD